MTFGFGKPLALSWRQRQSVTAETPSLARSFGPVMKSMAASPLAAGDRNSLWIVTVRLFDCLFRIASPRNDSTVCERAGSIVERISGRKLGQQRNFWRSGRHLMGTPALQCCLGGKANGDVAMIAILAFPH
jgi:hypothetical protein